MKKSVAMKGSTHGKGMKKKLKHMEVMPAANGGAVVRHHFQEPESRGMGYQAPPPAEEHVFGAKQGAAFRKHMSEHAGFPAMGAAGDANVKAPPAEPDQNADSEAAEPESE